MNIELILEKVRPYTKDNQLTFKNFRKLFHFLSRQEQGFVIDVLIGSNIRFITDDGKEYAYGAEVSTESGASKDDFNQDVELIEPVAEEDDLDVLDDEKAFKNKSAPNSGFLLTYKNIQQSNEILCALIQDGNEQAEQDLCIKNKRLVQKYAWAYGKKYRTKLSADDIEQAGMIGMIKAAKKFDSKKGYAFSTYATWWIRQAIIREIYDTGFIIRLPVHMMEKISKIGNLENLYIGQGISHNECITKISMEMEIPEEYVEYCMALKTNYLSMSSLNSPVGEDDGSELMDFIPIENEKTIEDMVMMQDLRKSLEDILSSLSTREQKVLRLRFGMDDGRTRTLEEIGQKFNVTRERIRQIEAKAIRKLSKKSVKDKLRSYLEG